MLSTRQFLIRGKETRSRLLVEVLQHRKHRRLDQDIRVQVSVVLGFELLCRNRVHGEDVRETIGVSLEVRDDGTDGLIEETNDDGVVGEDNAAISKLFSIHCGRIPKERELLNCIREGVFGGEKDKLDGSNRPCWEWCLEFPNPLLWVNAFLISYAGEVGVVEQAPSRKAKKKDDD